MNKFRMKPFVFFNAENVRIQLDDRSYDIQIGQNLLQGLSGDGAVPAGTAALVVTNETVQPLYGSRLVVALKQRYPVVHTVTLPDGEEHKNWPTLNLIFDALLSHACDRKVVLYALSTCGWCARTKQLLTDLGVEFSYVYVDLLTGDEQGTVVREVEKWNPRLSFPTIVIDGSKVIIGFREEEIRKAVGA